MLTDYTFIPVHNNLFLKTPLQIMDFKFYNKEKTHLIKPTVHT